MRCLTKQVVGAWIVALACALPANAASPLDHVPAKSPLIVHLRGFEGTKERVFTMLEKALPDLPMADMRKQFDGWVKETLQDRELKGMTKDGSIIVAMTEWPEGGMMMKPLVAVIVRVDNYKEFRDGILDKEQQRDLKQEQGYEVTNAPNGDDLYFIDHKGYAVITDSKALAKQYVKQFEGITKQLGEENAKKICESDASLYLDIESVYKVFGDQIKDMKDMIVGLLENQGQDAETTKAVIDGLVQFTEDSKHMIVGVNFQPDGLALQTSFGIKGDSTTDKLIKVGKPSALAEVGKLPRGRLSYIGLSMDTPLAQMAQTYILGMPGKGNKELDAALATLKKADAVSLSMCMDLPMQGIYVTHYKDPAKGAEGQLKLLQSMKEEDQVQSLPIKGKPEIKQDAENYRDFKLSYARLVWDFQKMFEDVPNGEGMVDATKVMVGEDMKIWFGTNGKVNIQVMAKDWDAAKQIIDQFLDAKDQTGDDKAFQEARKKLPAELSMVSLTDLPSYSEVIGKFVLGILKNQGMEVKVELPKLTKGTAFMSAGLLLKSGSIQADVWIPGKGIGQISKLIVPFFEAVEPQPPPPPGQ